MKIEEHLEHYENPSICIDPDNCPVVYASIMQQWEDEQAHGEWLKRE